MLRGASLLAMSIQPPLFQLHQLHQHHPSTNTKHQGAKSFGRSREYCALGGCVPTLLTHRHRFAKLEVNLSNLAWGALFIRMKNNVHASPAKLYNSLYTKTNCEGKICINMLRLHIASNIEVLMHPLMARTLILHFFLG